MSIRLDDHIIVELPIFNFVIYQHFYRKLIKNLNDD